MKLRQVFAIFSIIQLSVLTEANFCQKIYDVSHDETHQSLSQREVIDSISELQDIFYGPSHRPSKEEMKETSRIAKKEMQEMENIFGVEYSSAQKKIILQEGIDQILSPRKYTLIYSPPSIQNKAQVEVFEIYRHRYQKAAPEDHQIVARLGFQMTDARYFENLNGANFNALEVKPKHCHLFVFSELDSIRATKKTSTMRVLERSSYEQTIIEKFLQRNLEVHSIQKLRIIQRMNQNVMYNNKIFEVGRVSNGSESFQVMKAQKLLLKKMLAEANVNALFVLSTTQEKLVAYYQKWGFELDDIVDVNGSKIYLMSSTSENLK